MKKIYLILLSFVAMISSCTMDTNNQYTITGNGWEKYNGKEFRVLVRDTTDSGISPIGTGIIKNGQFAIEGIIEHPQTAFLGVYTAEGEFAGWKQNFIAESGKINLELQVDTKKAIISGGKYYRILIADIDDKPAIKSATRELDAYSKKYYALKKEEQDQDANDLFMKLYQKHDELLRNAYTELFNKHEDPYVRLLCISHLRGMENVKEELTKLEKEIGIVPEISMYRYNMKMTEETAKNRKSVGIGSLVKDFTAKNLEGESFYLSSVLKENKYVLVEFWASWCAPCRAEIPHMKEAYLYFKDKDFEIVSFTLDHVKKSWEKASDKEEIPWINVGDLKAQKSPVVQMYGVNSVPANFLVNKEGEIVAVNLRGKQLDDKLKKLLN